MLLSRVMGHGSSRPNTGHVKPDSTWARLFDGWQVGLVVIATAVLAALIAVPRPVLPDEIPRPSVDRKALAELSGKDAERARIAAVDRLAFEVRALGETIRSYGVADAEGDRDSASRHLTAIQQRVPAAVALGVEPVLQLRAVQLHSFLREIEVFERSGVESAELRQVGGGLVAMARRAGWIVSDGAGAQVKPDRFVREALFRKRWNEITGLVAPPFQTSLAEERVFYAFLLSHPIVSVQPAVQGNPVARCHAANEFLLRKVDELGRIDRSYPTGYARGVLLLRLDRPREALLPLVEFVEKHDDGPWVLRARNALREAQERVDEMER